MDLLFLAPDRAADVDRPGDIRAIAAHRAAEIKNDRVALGDAAVTGLVVRRGAIPGRSDDRECDLVVTLGAKKVGQVRTDLALRPTGERTLEDPCVSTIRGLGHRSERLDLGGVLAHP